MLKITLSIIKYNNKDKQINTAPNDVKTIVTSIDQLIILKINW